MYEVHIFKCTHDRRLLYFLFRNALQKYITYNIIYKMFSYSYIIEISFTPVHDIIYIKLKHTHTYFLLLISLNHVYVESYLSKIRKS